ncbi:immunoglobulin I-set domain protein, partial [Ostertagia ostertagi]
PNNAISLFKDARESDAGSYSCVVDNIAGREISVAKLVVGSVPSIVPSSQTVSVNIEEEVILHCKAIGYPSPNITWLRNGVLLDSHNHSRYTVLPDGHLLITSQNFTRQPEFSKGQDCDSANLDAQLEDQTTFTCIAKNEYGAQSKTTSVKFNLILTVSPVLGHVPPEEQLIEGEDLRLSCVIVLGTPRPQIKWFRDGAPIKPSSSL